MEYICVLVFECAFCERWGVSGKRGIGDISIVSMMIGNDRRCLHCSDRIEKDVKR